jgi:hypothetical protein
LDQTVKIISTSEDIERNIHEIICRYLPPNYPTHLKSFSFIMKDIVNSEEFYKILDHSSVTVNIKSQKRITDMFSFFGGFKVTECSLEQVRHGEEIYVIKPSNIPEVTELYSQTQAEKRELWEHSVIYAEDHFNRMLAAEVDLETAKSILPLCTRMEIFVTGSLKDWIEYFSSSKHLEELDMDLKLLNEELVYEIGSKCPNVMDSLMLEREETL